MSAACACACVSTRGGEGLRLEIDRVMKCERAKILRKIAKLKCRSDVLHSKREERGGKDIIKVHVF